ncbi:MAG: 1-acyl-sn-glycerol-3-phosphate acyltransferase [Leptospiraceae bacterium]|nr:1-acyl-sn-glycerol-3-phosphate acyltransferase [Leptospiraceae bacterium]MCB1304123.1 1-acyl-sn-glycerol-3-phosphate acyltransferase [Leptospiraceae bacterium]
MEPFIPPGFSLPLAWGIDFSLPVLLRFVQNLEGVVILPEDQKMLRDLRKERILYCSNHPTVSEPPVAYAVAKAMGARFHYMAARQVFDWANGVVGRVIQGVGAYSVLAGTADRESIKMSRGILAHDGGKLVVYPEGEPTSGENDNLLPLQPGIAQIGFWGLEDARKMDPGADIKVLPAFVKYVYSGTDASIKGDLHSSVKKLERKLGIDPANKNLLRRFLTIGRIVLEQCEADYQIAAASLKDWDYRVGRVRHAVLDQVADRIQVKGYNRSADAIEKLRFLLSILEMISVEYPDPRLPSVDEETLKWAQKECEKAYLFIVTRPEYLISYPTAERFYEWLGRYETFVLGKTSARGRKAHVRFTEPISLGEYYSRYKENRKSGIEALLGELKNRLERLLVECQQLSQPIVRPFDVGDDPMGQTPPDSQS